MPNIAEITTSDDEYQDANSEVSSISNSEQLQKDSTNEAKTTEADKNVEVVTEKLQGLHHSEESKVDLKNEEPKSIEADDVDDDINEDTLLERDNSLTQEDLENNKEKAETLKLKANQLFNDNKPLEAIELYTDALKICPIKYKRERAMLYSNRAAAKIKIDSRKSAICDCSKAIDLWPEYVRALLRRAKLYELDNKLDEALEDYKRVNELDPGHNEARAALLRLPPLIEERNERLKEEMLGKLKDLGNMILKPFGLSTSNFQMQKDPASGSYSINFNQNST